MKKNIFAIGALVVAIVLSSFSTTRFATVYFVYQSGDEDLKASYTHTTTSQNTDITGSTTVAWFKGSAANASNPTDQEFTDSFELIDGDYGGTNNDQLSDETNESTANFEKK